MRIDDLDKRIIVALEEDGRRPYRDIARDLDVAEATVRARVNRLSESGLIRITAVGDPLGLGVSTTAITLIRTRPGTVHEVAEALAQLPTVRFVGVSFGSADIVIQTLHRDMRALHDFVAIDLPRLAPDIVGTETLQLADVLKSSWDWRAWFAEADGPGGDTDHRNDHGASRGKDRATVHGAADGTDTTPGRVPAKDKS
ncbi:MAG TPA: Lrp/AsnC family transcriptional regulator [Trueperaceae bacterium]|nr:Lrp/AsnC family transcriptional regulator [Trueperaceae bacterium]